MTKCGNLLIGYSLAKSFPVANSYLATTIWSAYNNKINIKKNYHKKITNGLIYLFFK